MTGDSVDHPSHYAEGRKLKGRIGPNDVTTDWKLPPYPSFVIVSIYEGSRPYLKSAVALLEYEIDHLHRKG